LKGVAWRGDKKVNASSEREPLSKKASRGKRDVEKAMKEHTPSPSLCLFPYGSEEIVT
jgi:hypothetical protein